MDGLAYDLTHDIWNDSIYAKAMKKKEIDIVLAENPFIELNIVRAMVLRKRYGFSYSNRLKNVIRNYTCEQQDWMKQLKTIQNKRYGYIIIMNVNAL